MENAAGLLAAIADDAASKIKNVKEPLAEVRITALRATSAAAFKGLRQRLAVDALQAKPKGDITKLVTPIVADKRGKYPVDSFSVMDNDMLNSIFSGGSFHWHQHTNGAAIKIVPPLDVSLRGKRDEAGNILEVKVLEAKVHFVALQENHETPMEPIFVTDDAGFAYPPDDRDAYKRAMAGALKGAAATMQGLPAGFVAWANAVPVVV